jgi:aquaporin-9
MNPAVSFSMLLLGRLSPCKFMIYSFAQLIGSLLASFSVFLVYNNALSKYPKGMYSIETAGIFGTYPNDLNDETNTFSMFFEQFFATALFLIAILAITDKKNYDIPHPMAAILIGMALTGIATAFGYNSGFAVNPVRDFGPRFFTLVFGWGGKTFSAGNFFFWIPVLGPMLGAAFGTSLYHLFINIHLSDEYYN